MSNLVSRPERKPTFNVNEEFLGVTSIHLNKEFRKLLLNFLFDMEDDDLETEIKAFRSALYDPIKNRKLRDQRRIAKRTNGYNEHTHSY